ncbi:hypothetical protein ACWV95_18865 [Streptomyces albus]
MTANAPAAVRRDDWSTPIACSTVTGSPRRSASAHSTATAASVLWI